ncbi:MAG: hypothetical protein KAS39_01600, partial [Actinomycetia bacterium]|nr:hypothetical protein [Actinomycetes bacterium]
MPDNNDKDLDAILKDIKSSEEISETPESEIDDLMKSLDTSTTPDDESGMLDDLDMSELSEPAVIDTEPFKEKKKAPPPPVENIEIAPDNIQVEESEIGDTEINDISASVEADVPQEYSDVEPEPVIDNLKEMVLDDDDEDLAGEETAGSGPAAADDTAEGSELDNLMDGLEGDAPADTATPDSADGSELDDLMEGLADTEITESTESSGTDSELDNLMESGPDQPAEDTGGEDISDLLGSLDPESDSGESAEGASSDDLSDLLGQFGDSDVSEEVQDAEPISESSEGDI